MIEPPCSVTWASRAAAASACATGPQDCGLVYLVRSDPELREELAARRRERRPARAD